MKIHYGNKVCAHCPLLGKPHVGCPRMERGMNELDALIAEKVFGQPKPIYSHPHPHIDPIKDGVWVCCPDYYKGDACEWEPLPFSSDIAAAWKVVERIASGYPDFSIWHSMGLDEEYPEGWYVTFGMDGAGWTNVGPDTAPRAICLAALKATS